MNFDRALVAALLLAGAAVSTVQHRAVAAPRMECPASADLTQLSQPLAHFTARLLNDEDITILALGSSSTEGTGASRKEFSYPSRLAGELHRLLPRVKIKVLNRGVGGEDAKRMLSRLDQQLAKERPDLVLWQVGTNALLAEKGVESQEPLIRTGLRKIRAAGADAILIDPQYAPYVLRDPDARPMVRLLAKLADEAGVPVFRRFELMQYWHEAREVAFSDILAPDLFHMNDWSYSCLARNLAAAMIANFSAQREDTIPAAAATSTAEAPATAPQTAAATAPQTPAPGSAPVTSISALR